MPRPKLVRKASPPEPTLFDGGKCGFKAPAGGVAPTDDKDLDACTRGGPYGVFPGTTPPRSQFVDLRTGAPPQSVAVGPVGTLSDVRVNGVPIAQLQGVRVVRFGDDGGIPACFHPAFPALPNKGDRWLDTRTLETKEWNGVIWAVVDVPRSGKLCVATSLPVEICPTHHLRTMLATK